MVRVLPSYPGGTVQPFLPARRHRANGIPILSDLPIVGGLFGFQDRRTTETELFLFITPRVLRDDAEADAAAREALDQVDRTGIRLDSTEVKRP